VLLVPAIKRITNRNIRDQYQTQYNHQGKKYSVTVSFGAV
jgi:hypothetical protein